MAKIKVESQSTGTGIYTLKTGAASTNYSATLPDATGTLLMTDGDGSSLSGVGGGKVLQVVMDTDSTGASTSSTSYIDTGLDASITPLTGSKVLVLVSQQGVGVSAATTAQGLNLVRGSTQILEFSKYWSDTVTMNGGAVSTSYLDSSPGGDGSTVITYKTQMKRDQGSGTVSSEGNGSTSTLTLIEIGA